MKEVIKLTHIVNGQEQGASLHLDAIKLDEELWAWLQSAFVGIGFNPDGVREFFGKVD